MTTTVAQIAEASSVEAVYRQDGARLWRALYAYAGDENVASDAVSEAFAQALRRGAAVLDVRGWVWRTAFHIAAGDLKKRARYTNAPIPDRGREDAHPNDQLLAALGHLTPQQRAAIVLHYYADCSVREIARRTGMNPLSVRAHLSRGRKRLRLELGDEQ